MSDLTDHLLLMRPGEGDSSYQAALSKAAGLLTETMSAASGPRHPATYQQLQEEIAAVKLHEPLNDLDDALAEIQRIWLDYAVWYHDPAYLAHLNCPVAVPALAAEVLATGVNTAVESWDQATTAALIECRLIHWLAELAGFAPEAEGTFTSGGTQSNLQALYTAREKAVEDALGFRTPGISTSSDPEEKPRHVAGRTNILPRLRFFTSDQSHYSISRAAHILGLAPNAVVVVSTDPRGRLDPHALRKAIADSRNAGDIPAGVVATAGTTDLGAVDPLGQIAQVCRTANVHLHVDAAYGGGLLLSTRRRDMLNGIEHADSITVDFHKTFVQPVACSALVFQDPRDLAHTTWHADYLNPQDSGRLDLADHSLQTTRRFDALKLWVTVRTLGTQPIGEALDACCDLAAEVSEVLDMSTDFELIQPPQLSTLLFRYLPPTEQTVETTAARADRINPLIRESLFNEGSAIIAGTIHEGRPCLKFTMLNPATQLTDALRVLELIRHAGEHLTRPGYPHQPPTGPAPDASQQAGDDIIDRLLDERTRR